MSTLLLNVFWPRSLSSAYLLSKLYCICVVPLTFQAPEVGQAPSAMDGVRQFENGSGPDTVSLFLRCPETVQCFQ